MVWVEQFLIKYPELAVFLAISIGYLIGGLKFGGFSLGPVTGSLFAGILIGQFAHVPIAGMAKSLLFLLFLFGIGYSVGPQFLQALKRDGMKPVLLAVVVCVTGLLMSVVVAKILGLDPGFAAGLLSGSLTESPAMGTATEAINALPLPEADRARFVAHIAVADAVCYVFGAVGVILFCSVVGPRLLGIDLVAEALKLEKEYGITRKVAGVSSAWHRFEIRAYQIVDAAPVAGLSIAAAEATYPEHRLFIQRLRRRGAIIEAAPEVVINPGDIVAVSGTREALVSVLGPRAEEIEDRELLDVPVSVSDVLLTSPDLKGKSIADVAKESWTRSLYLRAITRGGQDIPIAPGITVERGDILRLVGPEAVVSSAAKRIGVVVAPTTATDFLVLGFAIFLGGLVGVLVTFPIGDMRISLSTSVGTLLAGLTVGHLRTRFPLFGRIPDAAVSLMTSLGLAAFVAMTGLHAGPVFASAIAEAGIGLLFGGMIVTMIPLIVGLYFGRYVLGMNPILLLGGLAGAQTMTAGMAAVQDRSGSTVAVLGYTPAVPIGHILLTTWGTVIVGIVAG
ncbi:MULTISPECIES: aspartate-alanine antiporter [Ensifer]|jgi:putative transport protein|uniref:Aspartate-alanine antiporter n=1 Tax=Ensifer canadensis TaxID=555315 RepID=A0AAW4FER8_9HYPH|nr:MULTISPECIES: aspartate-alanine antiporter [Ensifer]MDP9629440.1 putative transport protein [Ensifer adhaerens]KQW50194.1 aspartate-alanine antiporter [Ensifer sp. Root1252]KQY62955.1 aspartate-alanine antiporter [Ensifer sp. Root142]KRC74418.1 aspartate-alanine antiporter [Ensifer sp. Root231]KRD03131.1 aspartate-alanine antiporter [Ensifer sp. Root258]